MDDHAMHSGLAELQQLHVELNSEHSTYLHCSYAHCRQRKAGRGLETRLGYKRAEPSGLAVL